MFRDFLATVALFVIALTVLAVESVWELFEGRYDKEPLIVWRKK